MTLRLNFVLLQGNFALAHLPPGAATFHWNPGEFAAVLSYREGATVICDTDAVPPDVQSQSGYRCLKVEGTFGLESVGVVAAAVQPLAASGISLFAYSTWETDYILIQHTDLQHALSTLKQAGHIVLES